MRQKSGSMVSQDGIWGYEYRNSAHTAIEITDYHGQDECVVVPAEIDGLPVLYAGGFRRDNLEGRKVIISEGIKEIRTITFAFTGIVELTLPSSVWSLQKEAFFGCEKLEKIHFSSGLRWIGREVFRYCKSLKEARLPDTVYYLGTGAFEVCLNLQYAEIPAEMSHIGRFAFAGCDSLQTVRYSEKARFCYSFPKHTKRDIILFNKPEDRRTVCEPGTDLYSYPNTIHGKVIGTLKAGTVLYLVRRYEPSISLCELTKKNPDIEELKHNFWGYVRIPETGQSGYITKCKLKIKRTGE